MERKSQHLFASTGVFYCIFGLFLKYVCFDIFTYPFAQMLFINACLAVCIFVSFVMTIELKFEL